MEKNREYTQRSNRIDLFETLEVYISERQRAVTADRIKDYKTLKKHLTGFKKYSSQPVTFRNLNLKFYNEFSDYLAYKAEKPNDSIGLLTNTVGKLVRTLKGFVNY